MGAIKTMKEVESALPQKKEINYVRALDKEGNPILISKEDLAQVVGELIPVVTPEKDGLSNSKFATTKIKSEGKRSSITIPFIIFPMGSFCNQSIMYIHR